MSDFLEKHGISLEKPDIKNPSLPLEKPKERYIKFSEVFTFEDSIHFARFILSNKDELKEYKLIIPILSSTTAYNRACCGDSRRNWQRIIDGFSKEADITFSNKLIYNKLTCSKSICLFLL